MQLFVRSSLEEEDFQIGDGDDFKFLKLGTDIKNLNLIQKVINC